MAKPKVNIQLKNANYPSGRRPIIMVVSFKNKRSLISLGHSAHPAMWDKTAKRCTLDDPEAEVINGVIYEYKDHAKFLIDELENQRKRKKLQEIPQTAADIAGEILKDKQPEKATKKQEAERVIQQKKNDLDFIEYGENEVEITRKRGQYGLAGRYSASITKLKKWHDAAASANKGRYMVSEMKMKDIVTFHAEYLLGELKNHKSTAHVTIRNLKTIYNRAVKEYPYLKQYQNPFNDLNIKLPRNEKKVPALSFDDMKKLATVKLPEDMGKSRDIFIFCYECMGIRISDAIALKWSQVQGDEIVINARKTDKLLQAEITEPMRKILDRYKGESPEYVFGLLRSDMTDEYIAQWIKTCTVVINRHLKRIAAIAAIKSIPHSAMRTHLARHSFAHHVYADTLNIQLVKEICQHEDIRITERYIGRLGFKELKKQMQNYRNERKKNGLTL
jgi:integrase